MYLKKVDGPRAVKTLDGRVLCITDLPEKDTKRWVASRKETVVLAVEHGLISKESAMERYGLSNEEFDNWCMARNRYGSNGLKATHAKGARQPKVVCASYLMK